MDFDFFDDQESLRDAVCCWVDKGFSFERCHGIAKAGGTDTEKLVAAFKGLELMSPFGKISYRTQDNQATMGAYVGKTKNDGGKGVMVDYVYLDGAKFQPSDEEVKKMRPAD